MYLIGLEPMHHLAGLDLTSLAKRLCQLSYRHLMNDSRFYYVSRRWRFCVNTRPRRGIEPRNVHGILTSCAACPYTTFTVMCRAVGNEPTIFNTGALDELAASLRNQTSVLLYDQYRRANLCYKRATVKWMFSRHRIANFWFVAVGCGTNILNLLPQYIQHANIIYTFP